VVDCEITRRKCEFYEKILWLAARDVVFFSTYNQEKEDYDGWFHPFILCNDTFGYACADAEEVGEHDVDVLTEVFKKYEWDGVIAFVSKKRGVEVIKELRTERYKEAMEYLG